MVAVLGFAGWLYAQDFPNASGRNLPVVPQLFGFDGRNAALLEAFQSRTDSARFSGRGALGSGWIAGWGTAVQLPALFKKPGSTNHNLKFGLHNTGPGSLQRFDPLKHGGPDLRGNFSIESTRLSYRDVLRPRDPWTNGGFGFGSGTTNSSSSSIANGAFSLSATTTYAGRPITGSVRAGKNSMANVPGGQRHSGPSLGLRLTF